MIKISFKELFIYGHWPKIAEITQNNRASSDDQGSSNKTSVWNLIFNLIRFLERFKKSSIISMQKMLNNDASKKEKIMTKINNYVPVNYDCMQSLSLRK